MDVRTSGNNVLIKKTGNRASCSRLFCRNGTSLQPSTTQTPSSFKGRGQASGPASAGIRKPPHSCTVPVRIADRLIGRGPTPFRLLKAPVTMRKPRRPGVAFSNFIAREEQEGGRGVERGRSPAVPPTPWSSPAGSGHRVRAPGGHAWDPQSTTSTHAHSLTRTNKYGPDGAAAQPAALVRRGPKGCASFPGKGSRRPLLVASGPVLPSAGPKRRSGAAARKAAVWADREGRRRLGPRGLSSARSVHAGSAAGSACGAAAPGRAPGAHPPPGRWEGTGSGQPQRRQGPHAGRRPGPRPSSPP